MAHLVDDEDPGKDTNCWTRVFTRDELGSRQQSVHLLGPDLIYDKAMRDSLGNLNVSSGAVAFSPFMFKRADLSGDLEQRRIAYQDLMGLGQVATEIKRRFIAALVGMNAGSDHGPEEPIQEPKRGYSRLGRGAAELGGTFDALEYRE